MIKKQHTRYNKRKKPLSQLLIPIVKILLILTILGLTIWGISKIRDSEFLKTDIQWKIDSTLPITQTVLERKIQPLIDTQYQLDLHEIKQTLESEPWVATAHISRLFFSAIEISIKSQKIAMRWKNTNCKKNKKANCTGYIFSNGELFIPKKMTDTNVTLAHSKADQTTITQLYRDYQNYQKIVSNMSIKSFSRTHIDQLIFKPDIKVILGYQQKHQRLARFLKTYKKLRKKIAKAKLQRATFDMRYPKGFSLKY